MKSPSQILRDAGVSPGEISIPASGATNFNWQSAGRPLAGEVKVEIPESWNSLSSAPSQDLSEPPVPLAPPFPGPQDLQGLLPPPGPPEPQNGPEISISGTSLSPLRAFELLPDHNYLILLPKELVDPISQALLGANPPMPWGGIILPAEFDYRGQPRISIQNLEQARDWINQQIDQLDPELD